MFTKRASIYILFPCLPSHDALIQQLQQFYVIRVNKNSWIFFGLAHVANAIKYREFGQMNRIGFFNDRIANRIYSISFYIASLS